MATRRPRARKGSRAASAASHSGDALARLEEKLDRLLEAKEKPPAKEEPKKPPEGEPKKTEGGDGGAAG